MRPCECGRERGFTFEDGGVAGLDGEACDVGDDLGTGFEDDEENADGAGYTFHDEVVIQLRA